MPWPVYLAFKHLFPTGKKISFFTAVSVLGVTLGVTVLVAVSSVMNGFGHEWEVNLIAAQGEINIRSGELIDEDTATKVVQMARATPGVKSAEPYALGWVAIKLENRALPAGARSVEWPPQFPRTPAEHLKGSTDSVYPSVEGIDVSDPKAPRPPLADKVIFGSFDKLNDDSVLLGEMLASELGANVGDKVEAFTPLMLDRLQHGEVLLPREFTVAGVYRTGWTVADEGTIALTMRTMQDLYGLDGYVHGIEVRLDNSDLAHVRAVTASLNQQLGPLNTLRMDKQASPLRADTWEDTNFDLTNILKVEKNVMFYIMIFIVVVAAFSIASSLVTSVVRKTREIGVLGAMGARPGQVAAVFCLQGLFIGVCGVVFGVALALLLLHYRQAIVTTFVEPEVLVTAYHFLSFPVEYRAADFVKITAFTLLVTTLAGLLPAWRAARLKPAECLRAE